MIHEIANSQTEQQRGPRHSWTRSRWQDATARQRRLVVGALTALLVVSTWGVSQLAIRYLNYDTQPRYPSSVGSRAPAAASLVNPAQYDPGRKFTRAADRIASSLDDPRLDRRYRDLQQRIAKAAQPVALTGANALLRDPFTTEKNWDRDVSVTDKEIERLMKSGPYSLVRNPSNSR